MQEKVIQISLSPGENMNFCHKDGRLVDHNMVDYYGDGESIEVGSDENMHESIIICSAYEIIRGLLMNYSENFIPHFQGSSLPWGWINVCRCNH